MRRYSPSSYSTAPTCSELSLRGQNIRLRRGFAGSKATRKLVPQYYGSIAYDLASWAERQVMNTEICERSSLTGAAGSMPARKISTFLARQTRDVGASHYLLLDATGCVVSCNWIYDAVAEVGLSAFADLAESPATIWPGKPIRGYHPLTLAALTEHDEIAALAYYGHQEMFVLAVPTGKSRFLLLLSASKPERIAQEALSRTQMACSYALSRLAPFAEPPVQNPLSRREVECLSWVAQGKTTDEVALILDVSTNTINSQIAHAIHTLEAKNRAMAIATAIRRKFILAA